MAKFSLGTVLGMTAKNYSRDSTAKEVCLEILKESDSPVSLSALREKGRERGYQPTTIQQTISNLACAGLVSRAGWGLYCLPDLSEKQAAPQKSSPVDLLSAVRAEYGDEAYEVLKRVVERSVREREIRELEAKLASLRGGL